eukprot:RCo012672
MQEWDELLGFLTNPKPEVRKIAVQNVVAYTRSEEHVRHLVTKRPDTVRQLCNLLGDELSIAGDACLCLINLCSEAALVEQMLHCGVIRSIMSTIVQGEVTAVTELKLVLVSNLTASNEQAMNQLLQTDDEDLKGFFLERLLGWFVSFLPPKSSASEGPPQHIHWVMAIVTNVSSNALGQVFLAENKAFLGALRALLASNVLSLRRGATSTVRNLLLGGGELCLAALFRQEAEGEGGQSPGFLEGLLVLLSRLETGAEDNKEIRSSAVEVMRKLSQIPPGVGFLDSIQGKPRLRAAAQREALPSLRDTLTQVAESLDDVQDAYVIPDAADQRQGRSPAQPSVTSEPQSQPEPETCGSVSGQEDSLEEARRQLEGLD